MEIKWSTKNTHLFQKKAGKEKKKETKTRWDNLKRNSKMVNLKQVTSIMTLNDTHL